MPNPSHLAEALDHYRSLNEPGHALLVTGAWGTGKTTQVQRLLPPDKSIWVKLDGVTTVEQLHAEVLAAAYPTMGGAKRLSESMASLAEILSPHGRIARVIPNVAQAIMRRHLPSDRNLVFDDLERCTVPPAAVLGAINDYVEERGMNVVVITDDSKLAEEFGPRREKLFGRTVRVQPQTEAALDAFVSNAPYKEVHETLSAQAAVIQAAFAASKQVSLRILRHVVEDTARLLHALEGRHRAHDGAMRALIGLFAAIAVEVRGGSLEKADLASRREALLGGLFRKDQTPSPIQIANDRHSDIDLADPLLPDNLLASMIVDGHFPRSEIRAVLDGSRFFREPDTVPPWRVVIDLDMLPDGEIEAAISEMNRQVAEHEKTAPGELLHVATLRLMLTERGVMPGTQEEREAEAVAYIDAGLRTRWLEPPGRDAFEENRLYEVYDHFSYWVTDETRPAFDRIVAHMRSARATALERSLPDSARELLSLMRDDPTVFAGQVAHQARGDGRYAQLPVLQCIPPEDFLDVWLGDGPGDHRWRIAGALEDRYSHPAAESSLADERDWVGQLAAEHLRRQDAAPPLEKMRLERIVPKVFEIFPVRTGPDVDGPVNSTTHPPG